MCTYSPKQPSAVAVRAVTTPVLDSEGRRCRRSRAETTVLEVEREKLSDEEAEKLQKVMGAAIRAVPA